jgi:N-acetylglucosamine malate deacetylase 2
MKKIIFGIFAHPDDEAFGPAGTLLRETRSGTELHLVALTAGDGGTNPDNVPDLGAVRLEEWKKAGSLLNTSSMEFFGYKDGQLNNTAMIEIGQRLVDHVLTILKDAPPEDAVVEFMTLDLNGYTGHIDHIVAARAASYAFYTLKKSDPRLSRIRFACLARKIVPKANIDWVFMEAGRTPEEIDEIVDTRDLRDDILQIMAAHRSQRNDYEFTLRQQGDDLGLNYFIIKE